MSTEAKERDKKDPFAYSWYLPVTGGKTPAGGGPPEPSPEPEPEPENEGMVESGQAVEEPAPKQSAASSRPGEPFAPLLDVSPYLLRVVGLSVWSVISGVGMIALLLTQSTFPTNQFLALGGVWAVVSALIWFLPGKLTK